MPLLEHLAQLLIHQSSVEHKVEGNLKIVELKKEIKLQLYIINSVAVKGVQDLM